MEALATEVCVSVCRAEYQSFLYTERTILLHVSCWQGSLTGVVMFYRQKSRENDGEEAKLVQKNVKQAHIKPVNTHPRSGI